MQRQKVSFEEYITRVTRDKLKTRNATPDEKKIADQDLPLSLHDIHDIEGNFFENFGKNSNIACNLVDIDLKEYTLPSKPAEYEEFERKLKSDLKKKPDWKNYWKKIEDAHQGNQEEIEKIERVKQRILDAYVFKISTNLYVLASLAKTITPEQRKMIKRDARSTSSANAVTATSKSSSAAIVQLTHNKESKENTAEKRLRKWLQERLPKYNENQKERGVFRIPIFGKKISLMGRKHDKQVGILAVLFNLDLPQKKLVKAKDVEIYKVFTPRQKVDKTIKIALAQLKRWGVTHELIEAGEKQKIKAKIRENFAKEGRVLGRIMIGVLYAIYNDVELAEKAKYLMELGAAIREIMPELEKEYKVEQLPSNVRTPSDWLRNRLMNEYKGNDKEQIEQTLIQQVQDIDGAEWPKQEQLILDNAKARKLKGEIKDEADDKACGELFAKKERQKFIAHTKLLDDCIKAKDKRDPQDQMFLEKTLCDIYTHYGRFLDMRGYTPLKEVQRHESAEIGAVNEFPDAGDLRTTSEVQKTAKIQGLLNNLLSSEEHDDETESTSETLKDSKDNHSP